MLMLTRTTYSRSGRIPGLENWSVSRMNYLHDRNKEMILVVAGSEEIYY
jgi:hypothetical protein